MSAKHTAGSWHVETINARLGVYAILPDGVRESMHVRIEAPMDDESGERTKADAQLIAAAPELLDALQTLYVGTVEQWPLHDTRMIAAMRAARLTIFKAEWRKP